MKYCLSARQSKEYIQKADELLVQWEDHEHIIDLMEMNPKASYVLEIIGNNLEDKDWDLVNQYYIMTKKKLKVSLSNLNYYYCKEKNIPFFFSMAISEPWMLNAVIDLGVCAARITGELAHKLDYLDTLPIEIRVWANRSGAPFNYNPIIGGWFRPEDLNDLTAIDVCEFDFDSRKEEQALYRIYAENKNWPGELYLLVKDIKNEQILNRVIPPEFQKRRSNCGMRCMSGSHCHYCQTVCDFAKYEFLNKLKGQINDRIIKESPDENSK